MEVKAIRRLVYRFYRLLGWSVILILFFLIAIRGVVYYFSPTSAQLIAWAKQHFPYGLVIQSAETDFVGWNPAIKLNHVEVLTEDSHVAFKVDEVKVVFNPFALLVKKIDLSDIVIDGMNIGVEYLDGTIIVSELDSLKWKPNLTESSLMSIRRLTIKNSDIHLILSGKKSIPLARVDIRMDASHRFKMSGRADVVGSQPSIIEFVFDLPYFFKNEANLYCHWQGGDLSQLADFLPKQNIVEPRVGEIDAKVWVTIPEKGEKSIIGKVELSNLEISNNKNNIFLFEPVTGWIEASGEKQNWTLEAGWSQENDLQNYHLKAKVYPCSFTECIELQSEDIKLGQMAYWLEQLGILPSEFENMAQHYDVSGLLDSVFVRIKSFEGRTWMSAAELAFSNVALRSGREHPNIESLSGALQFEDGHTDILLESEKAEIEYRPWFSSPMTISNLKSWISLTHADEILCQTILSHAFLGQTSFTGGATLRLANSRVSDLELTLGTDEWPIEKALSILPKKIMDPDLLAWLNKALKHGKITQSTLLFRGDPFAFPFDKHEGIFDLSLALEDVTLDYQKDWPLLTGLEATLQFKNRQMLVNAKRASLKSGGKLIATKAVIPDLAAPIVMLEVDAKIKDQLEKAKNIILKSPLRDKMMPSLSPLSLQGEMLLDLGMEIPLSTKESAPPIQVNGAVTVSSANLAVPEIDFKVDNLQGKFSFTESSMMAEGLKGKMFGENTEFSIVNVETKEDTKFQIQADGYLSYADLVKQFDLPNYNFISGGVYYKAKTIIYSDFSKHPMTLEITSPLIGLAIKAPQPFGKEAETSIETKVKLEIEPQNTTRVDVDFGKETSLAIVSHFKDDKWEFKGGHLHFGENPTTKYRDDGVFLVDGYLPEMNLQEWKSFWGQESEQKILFEPILAINFGKLIFFGETFSKTNVEAQRDNTQALWNLNFDGPSIKGHISFPEGKDNREIAINLDKLTLASANNESSTWVDEKTVLEHPIEIAIEKLKIDKKTFTQFQARIEPSWKGYDFPRIQAKMKGTDIKLSGQWDVLTASKQVSAEGKIYTQNSSDTFKALGIAGTVHRAKGNIGFNIGWQGSPAKIDYPTLTGKADFKLNNGYVQGVNPGIGRVLNLLSLDTVQRRLNLDFNDVTRNGFAFDEFTAKFQFGKGKVSSNEVNLRGPSAVIEAYGQADLINQDISGEMVVMPKVTGSLPVAAAIAAGNPAVGAAVWMVDKMLGKKIQEIHRYRYRFIGTWDAPKLEEIPLAQVRRG